MEEAGYGLPEYSLYYSYDARSWTGRWYFSEYPTDVCWTFISDEGLCRKVNELISDLESKARAQGKELIFAVWR